MTCRRAGLALVVAGVVAWAADTAAQPARVEIPPPTTDLAPPLVRVLLEPAGDAAVFPQPGRPYRATCAGRTTWLWGPLAVRSGTAGAATWQVGAWADEAAAATAAGQLTQALGGSAAVARERGGDGLTRVVVGFATAPAGGVAAALAAVGYASAFALEADGAVVVAGHGARLACDGELLLEPGGDHPTEVGGRRYRGRFLLRGRGGRAQVVNQLGLEAYLRGVVPAEMSPLQFPELEALKAQAVAARTYAVAHRGDHDDDGWDLCATPACQVYAGAGAEHALTDRAVAETAGLVAVYQGQPIDAMYTSTCGGRTEAVEDLFSGGPRPYLRSVACAWERDLVLAGTAPASAASLTDDAFAEGLAAAALGLAAEASPDTVVAAVAGTCGGTVDDAAARGVDAFARRLLRAGGLSVAAERVARVGDADAAALVALVDLFGAALDRPPADWQRGWTLRAALAVLELQGVVVRDRGELVPHATGVAIFPRAAASAEPVALPAPLYARWGGRLEPAANLTARPGATLERVRLGDRVLALVVVRSGGGDEADRRSAWRSWTRERTWAELAARLGVPDLEALEVTRRTPAGRVIGLSARGRSGAVKEWNGFSVRTALDLPENLFAFHRRRLPDGSSVVRFLGRGWGHGVGLCQNGAYGLARAGQSFDRILATYYQGVELARVPED